MFGAPILSVVISPVQAAAIMLPTMVVMDAFGVWSWRARFDRQVFAHLLPAAILGIGLGYWFAASLSADWIRILVALVGLAFLGNEYFIKPRLFHRTGAEQDPPRHNRFWGWLCGAGAGFTSFVAHAGSPPYQIYVQPLRLEPILFASTAICFFAIVNVIKLVPYFALGQFDATNLMTSLVLLPLAPIAVFIGVYLTKRISKHVYYAMLNALLLILCVQLLWQGRAALLGA